MNKKVGDYMNWWVNKINKNCNNNDDNNNNNEFIAVYLCKIALHLQYANYKIIMTITKIYLHNISINLKGLNNNLKTSFEYYT